MKLRLPSLLLAITGLLASFLYAETASPFTDDLDAARAKARAEHKDVLVNFTGSDWCGWCIKLDKDVFLTSEFKREAEKHFELVQLDFPHNKTKQSAETTARNKAWKAELKSNSFPDILLLDEKGEVYAQMNYREGGLKPFMEHLESLRQRRIQRDAAMTKAEKASGLERARYLDEGMSALKDEEILLTYHRGLIDEILALDPKNEAGLGEKYRNLFKVRKCNSEIGRLCVGEDGAAMLSKLTGYAERSDIPVESRQYALYMAGAVACERFIKDNKQALELIEQAVALAPDSELAGDQLRETKLRLERKSSTSKVTKGS